MSPPPPWKHCPRLSFPRVSGDEPKIEKTGWYVKEFSPRERG